MDPEVQQTKYIFVTGGVVSGLGKGITAASLGRILKERGLKVTLQKFDPYINVDPGTMSPFQHGEVYVTDDGAETDLDLGHYERFTNESLSQGNSVSAQAKNGTFSAMTGAYVAHTNSAPRTRNAQTALRCLRNWPATIDQ